MSDAVRWRPISFERCRYMLEVVPPALQTPLGFLVGEPDTHRVCRVTGQFAAAFPAYAETDALGAYEAVDAMTVAEFRRLTTRDVLDHRIPAEVA